MHSWPGVQTDEVTLSLCRGRGTLHRDKGITRQGGLVCRTGRISNHWSNTEGVDSPDLGFQFHLHWNGC